ncbi:MAG TPA: ATP-binding cassette domain-containing protein [Synergistales bacterium]|nr:ATP-binding cassette domain-containing protein [Synergistales bacterium]
MSESLLQFKNVSKNYYGNSVLTGINFDVKEGEIHALIGENGAGKSTLMNILFGMPVITSTGGYEGDVLIDGKKISFKSPHEAMYAGIGMVHQEFMLIPGFSITENIKINREITTPNVVSRVLGKRLETLDMVTMNADAQSAG